MVLSKFLAVKSWAILPNLPKDYAYGSKQTLELRLLYRQLLRNRLSCDLTRFNYPILLRTTTNCMRRITIRNCCVELSWHDPRIGDWSMTWEKLWPFIVIHEKTRWIFSLPQGQANVKRDNYKRNCLGPKLILILRQKSRIQMEQTGYQRICWFTSDRLNPDSLGLWGEGIRLGKSTGTVNRGTIYIDLHINFVFGPHV